MMPECDHKWILLTTIRYESSVWEDPGYASDVRGCPVCGMIEFRGFGSIEHQWQTSSIVNAMTNETNTKLGSYIRGLVMFAGKRTGDE